MKYHWTKDPVIVNNADEESALGGGWADTSAAFVAYKRAKAGSDCSAERHSMGR